MNTRDLTNEAREFVDCVENADRHGVDVLDALRCDPDKRQLCDSCPFSHISMLAPGLFKFHGEGK